MGKLAGLIKEGISGDVLVNIKRNRLDIRVIGIISAVIAVIIMTIIGLTGNKAMDIFALFIAFGTSGFLFLYRPLSKMDASLKWIEIVCSLLLGLLGVIGFISFLNTGRLP
jgi:predicted tellurium resistance membrane protein TerC